MEKKGEPNNLEELMSVRRQKLEQLRKRGIDPYRSNFSPSTSAKELKENFENGKEAGICGRIFLIRDMGKSQFFEIGDAYGKIQCYLNKKEISEDFWEIWKLLERGDWVGVEGETFTTQKGEPTLKVEKLSVLAKSLRPLPDKWHGLTDQEMRYRKRHLDLISNSETAKRFIIRSKIIAEIRQFFERDGFLEVETPMLHDTAGGAAARPFLTHHNSLDMPLNLRIAPELYLKRLIVGGFPRIFEINRNFRNEGISRRHNPEFTMLEAYKICANFEEMADLVENLISHLAQEFCGTTKIPFGEEEIDLSGPWKRAKYEDLVREVAGENWFSLSEKEKRERAKELKVEISAGLKEYEITQQIFEKLLEAKIMNPCFVTHLPKELIPLACLNKENENLIDVFELIIGGQEISPGYSELNDPSLQRERFADQSGGESQDFDEDFLETLEYGMPSTGGIGIGIDRLVMLLTNANNIREVIFFPQLKPKE